MPLVRLVVVFSLGSTKCLTSDMESRHHSHHETSRWRSMWRSTIVLEMACLNFLIRAFFLRVFEFLLIPNCLGERGGKRGKRGIRQVRSVVSK